ncbi:MAG: hypothetical protein CMA50_01275 [Euryarchaeota archaeon]|mgnify:FL=1|nr:hypothetical protein [Euryarchaeota archaeon]|tara:strand:+ start:14449 stop:14652 length:204 start_codon:yes stop_codon:yes gene_type:complete
MLSKLIFLLSLTELTGSGGEQLFIEADNQVNNNFTTTQNNNYLAISPISITSGSVLTVTDGSIIDFY